MRRGRDNFETTGLRRLPRGNDRPRASVLDLCNNGVVKNDPELVETRHTRERVAQSVHRYGPSTANQLAERLGLTPAAIRRQLGALVAAGSLSSRPERVYGSRGRGRPSMVFELTDAGRELLGQTYDVLAIDALEYIERVCGPDGVNDFAAELAGRVVVRYEELRAAGTEPLDALVEALNLAGFVASVVPAPSGVQLCLHHCPVGRVAARFPQLCQAETVAVGRMLGSHVQRLATIAHGDGVCTTHVPDGSSTSVRRKVTA